MLLAKYLKVSGDRCIEQSNEREKERKKSTRAANTTGISLLIFLYSSDSIGFLIVARWNSWANFVKLLMRRLKIYCKNIML